MDLRTKLSLDGSDFGKTLEDAGKQVGDFQKKTEDASKSVDGMGKASSRTASELLKEMKGMENLGRSTGAYRQQLAQMTQQITDLTINYRNMSQEMKNSEFGREVAAKIEELTVKAGEYKDAIIDAQQSVKALASDTAGWDSMKMGIDTVSSSLQAFASLGLLGEQSMEKLVSVLAKLKAMEVATNTVIKIGNALQKQSALMMGVAKVQAMALARAKALETTATKGATIAQRIFNAVAKANPYVLLATAIIAVGTALFAFITKTDEAKKKEEELQRETDRLREKFENFKSKMSSAVGEVIGKFAALQAQWINLRTEADKKKWIDDNADAFKNLGLKITDVNSADKIFVEQSEAVIDALRTRAEATAALELYTENYKKVVEAQIDADERLRKAQAAPRTQFTAGSLSGSSIPEEWQAAGLTQRTGDLDYKWAGGQGGAGYWTLTEQGAQKYYDYVRQQGQAEVDRVKAEGQAYYDLWRGYEEAAEAAAANVQGLLTTTDDGSGNGSSNNTPTYDRGSVADYEAQIASLNKRLKEEALTYAEIRDIQGQIAVLQAQRDLAANGGMIPTLAPRTITLEPQIKMPEKLDPLPLPVELELKGFEDLVNETGNVISGLSSINSAVNSIGTSIENLGKGWDDSKSAIENITSTIGNMLTVLQSIVSITQTIQSISEAINALELIGMDIQLAKNIAKEQEGAIEAGQTGVKATNAAIDATGAAANVAKSASAIPVVGWVLALGAVAAIIAMIAGAGSSLNFANGGIVPGTSFSGDRIQANLNSGEMVLNTQQQRNLFNLLDGKSTYSNGGKVEFVIKGQELKGVLNNYDKKISRI